MLKSMAGVPLSLAQALAGRYRLDREIGRGGMATVYHAEDLRGGDRVAVKVLRPELTASIWGTRFHREIELLRRLRHNRIVPVLDSGEAGTAVYLVMPFVSGESLRARLEREGQLSIPAVLSITGDVADAIDYAHGENVIHRDIKPENILLDGERALVCDFGLARAIDRAALEPISSSGLVLGTPAYMSPEQATATEPVGPASDIYALGCVVYEMLTGELPFSGPTPQAVIALHIGERPRSMRTVRPDLPPHVESAVLTTLAKAPEDRPPSGAALLRMLSAG
jgi:serine/threonine protein kinase